MRSVVIFTLACALALGGVPAALPAPAAAEPAPLVVQLDTAKLLPVQGVDRVVVAAPDIADVDVITRNEVMVIAKHLGATTVSIWDARGLTTYPVLVVSVRPDDVGGVLSEALPGSHIKVQVVQDTIVLGGTVLTDQDKQRAEALAGTFAAKVVDLLTVQQPTPPQAEVVGTELAAALHAYPGLQVTVIGPDSVRIEGIVPTQYDHDQIAAIAAAFSKNVDLAGLRITAPVQVQIATVIAEVDVTALNNLGIEYGEGNATNLLTQPYIFNVGLFESAQNPAQALELLVARLHALEQRNAAKMLANPRLVVLDGQSAKLLVGGSIPIPTVANAAGAIAITYQDYGVRLEFTPTVRPNEPIQLKLLTEVSALDESNAVVENGFTIPALTIRHAETNVAMKPGEFLAIGGLLQRTDSKAIQKIPLLGDIPIIGALFRSTQFQHGETELVIFVSPSLVTPTSEAPAQPEMPNPDSVNPQP